MQGLVRFLDWFRMLHIGLGCTILPMLELTLVELIVLLLQFAHFFDFVKVYNEASFQIMQILDTLATENRGVLTAVEVFNTLLVLLTHVRRKVAFISLIIPIHVGVRIQTSLEVDPREKRVLSHYLVQNVKVEG